MVNAKGDELTKLKNELSAVEKIKEQLDESLPLRGIELSPEEEKAIRGFQFLSMKPMLVVFNLSEDELLTGKDYVAEFSKHWIDGQIQGVQLCADVEMEVSQLDDDDRSEFLKDYGIEKPASDRVINLSYDLLGLISFLTTGEDETRAWTVKKDALAPKAAGEVHSDIERGFIRAETVSYTDLIDAGSMAEGKKRGTVRLEGKNYEVQDGDIINFRFSV